eukprot:TRINITY_DN4044_c0_g1_i2.p1 TRINITY_DN4044_c0_g1~~TRINITY_DN4044_c0_g1_i2.p1  ORF type:complete len:466 (+),score=92.91 TRINITY_DN4044_c0_g1_i2:849-2246(+)
MRTPFWLRIVRCFCISRNTHELLRSNARNDEFISQLDGMRVVSIFWVVLGHTVVMGMGGSGITNMYYVMRDVVRRWTYMLLWSADFSVDSFFFMSGLVVAWKLYPCLKKGIPTVWSLILFVVFRYVRLTALLAVCILLDIYIIPLMIHGPWSYMYNIYQDDCREHWWAVLLYIQNLYPSPQNPSTCWPVSWYLANDMQFYLVLAPLLVGVSAYSWKLGWPLMITTLCTSFVTTSTLVAVNDYRMGMFPLDLNPDDNVSNIYELPWTRWQPYVIGIMTAVLLRQLQPYKEWIVAKFKWWASCGIFAAAGALMLTLIFGAYPVRRDGSAVWGEAQNVAWSGFTRGAWGVSLALFLLPCYFGHGGIISDLLGHRLFGPLSKLTYGIYLLHPIFIMYYGWSRWQPYMYNDKEIVAFFLSAAVIATALAYLSWLILERPVANLLGLLAGRRRRRAVRPRAADNDANENGV